MPRATTHNFTLDPLAIKFFTADIVPKAAMDTNSLDDQLAYHRALSSYRKGSLAIIKGYYSVTEVSAFQTEPPKDPRDCERINIWKLEEKQTDVNVSIEALYDAMTEPELEQVVFVTNDTDISPSMQKIKQHNSVMAARGEREITVGLVVPVRDSEHRRPNQTLSDLADWTVSYIKPEELEQSQLPHKVKTSRRYTTRPVLWHPQAEVLTLIMKELGDVMSTGDCWRWLEDSNKPSPVNLPNLNGKVPLDLIETLQGAQDVLAHAIAYRKFKRGL